MCLCCCRCPDGGPRASRMPAEDDYGPTTTTTSSSRRQQLLLHHANANSPSPVPSATTSAPPNLVVSVNGAATASSSANATASTASNCLNVTITSAVTCPAGCTITPDRLQVCPKSYDSIIIIMWCNCDLLFRQTLRNVYQNVAASPRAAIACTHAMRPHLRRNGWKGFRTVFKRRKKPKIARSDSMSAIPRTDFQPTVIRRWLRTGIWSLRGFKRRATVLPTGTVTRNPTTATRTSAALIATGHWQPIAITGPPMNGHPVLIGPWSGTTSPSDSRMIATAMSSITLNPVTLHTKIKILVEIVRVSRMRNGIRRMEDITIRIDSKCQHRTTNKRGSIVRGTGIRRFHARNVLPRKMVRTDHSLRRSGSLSIRCHTYHHLPQHRQAIASYHHHRYHPQTLQVPTVTLRIHSQVRRQQPQPNALYLLRLYLHHRQRNSVRNQTGSRRINDIPTGIQFHRTRTNIKVVLLTIVTVSTTCPSPDTRIAISVIHLRIGMHRRHNTTSNPTGMGQMRGIYLLPLIRL